MNVTFYMDGKEILRFVDQEWAMVFGSNYCVHVGCRGHILKAHLAQNFKGILNVGNSKGTT